MFGSFTYDVNGFNPRSRMGSDTMNSDRKNFRNVSIHAPVWGATYTRQHRPRIYLFQSTLPYGERQHFLHMVHKVVPFQSTLPYGERQHFVDIIATSHRFQSTLPYGERQSIALKINAIMIVSIHAPVWGATIIEDTNTTIDRFQSTLPYGERRYPGSVLVLVDTVSIHAPVWGATMIT